MPYAQADLDNYRLLPLGEGTYRVEVRGDTLGYIHPTSDRTSCSAHTSGDVPIPHPHGNGARNPAEAVTDLFRRLHLVSQTD